MTKIYVANLGAYNRGHLVGKWIELPQSVDMLKALLEDILHGEEATKTQDVYDNDEEVAIHDSETDMPIEISEYDGIYSLNRLVESFDDLSTQDQVFVTAIMEHGFHTELQEAIDHKDDFVFDPTIKTKYDLGYDHVHENFDRNTVKELEGYIKYEELGRDIEIGADGSITSVGYVYKM